MPNDHEQQKRAIADGIWLFLGDLVGFWFGLAMLSIVGGLMLVGIVMACEWLLGPDLGWQIGFWIVVLGGIVSGITWNVVWWKNELRRRMAENRHNREEVERIVR